MCLPSEKGKRGYQISGNWSYKWLSVPNVMWVMGIKPKSFESATN